MKLTSATRRLAACVAIAGAALAGCTTGGSSGSTTTTTSQPSRHGAVTLSCTRFTAAGPNCARTVTLAVGSSLHLVLWSTYWQVHPLAGGTPISEVGAPKVRPRPVGCVVGAGCGTVAVTYTAVRPGTVTVLATRSTCGEALGCMGATGRFALHVHVRPA